MRTKTGRFNYLPNYHESLQGGDTTDRVEYKEIISKLARDHQPHKNTEEIPAFDSPPRRSYSPIGQIQLKTRERSSNHIRSIILNEQITSIRQKQQRQKQKQKQRKDAYRIIKDSHIPKDQIFNDFFQRHKTPPKHYYSPFKEHKLIQEQQQPIYKFYQIKSSVPAKELKRSNPARNNQPYINSAAKIHEQSEKNQASYNPQLKQVAAAKMSDLGASGSNNKIYKLGYSQERIHPHQTSTNQYINQPSLPFKDRNLPCYKNNARKRSCYDYVPQQMKTRLSRQQ